MEGQATQQRPNVRQQELAIFDDWNAAQKAKELLQTSEDVSLKNIHVKGEIDVYEEVSAMGTTVGSEAGILIGAFIGGIIGLIFFSIYSTVAYSQLVNTPFGRFAVIAFTIAGSVFGWTIGNRIRKANLPEQKTKGNPNVPRRFRLMAEGDTAAIAKASEMLGYPTTS